MAQKVKCRLKHRPESWTHGRKLSMVAQAYKITLALGVMSDLWNSSSRPHLHLQKAPQNATSRG